MSAPAPNNSSPNREVPPDTATQATEPIAGLLVKNGYLTPQQLRYGRRVRAKLASPKPLLRVLEDLRFVTVEQIERTLRASEVPILPKSARKNLGGDVGGILCEPLGRCFVGGGV